MELCMNGCGNVWESRELLEVLESIIGVNKKPHDTKTTMEDEAMLARIERLAKRKLAKKGYSNAKVNTTR